MKKIAIEGGYKIKPKPTACASTLLARQFKGVCSYGSTLILVITNEKKNDI